MFALYLLSRAYDSVHSDLEHKGLFPKLTKSDHILFIVFVNALFTQLYFFEFQKQKINPSFYAILNNIFSTFQNKQDNILRDIYQKRFYIWN